MPPLDKKAPQVLPLSHITILDLSRVMAGPWATQLLADLGARVIKVEQPSKGDDTRQWGPPFLQNESLQKESAYYLSANRGKKSITLNFADPRGKELLLKLIAKSDILIENYKVGGLKKYALAFDDLKDQFPQLIYCSLTGFGQTGPFKDQAGYDYMIQGMGGLMSITGSPESGPMRVGVPIVDLMTGLYAANGLMAALMMREKNGQGTYIDLALFDVQVAMLANQMMSFLVSGEVPTRIGNQHPTIVPYQVFKAQDDYLILAIGNDDQYRKFCQIAQCEELGRDSRFVTNAGRVHHRGELIPLLEKVISKQTKNWWVDNLGRQQIPCGSIQNFQEVWQHPQAKERNLFSTLDHPLQNNLPFVNNPLKFSNLSLETAVAPPLLGQHNQEIYQDWLGLQAEELVLFHKEGVI